MNLLPDHYLQAAQERLVDARTLHVQRRYPAALYLCGVATECLLRAYRLRTDKSFEGRHDLAVLMKASGLAGFVNAKDQKRIAALMGEIWSRWKNNYRFASDERLRANLKKAGLDRGVRGDFLKKASEDAFNCASEVIQIGARRWNSKKK